MSLATLNQLNNALRTHLESFPEEISLVAQENSNFSAYIRDTFLLTTYSYQLPSLLPDFLNYGAPSASTRKYKDITNATWKENSIDFMYHWITNFSELTTKEQIQQRLQNPDTAGAFATTIALNKLVHNQQLSEKQIKTILKGNRWRWKKINNNYIQQTLYYDARNDRIPMLMYNPLFPEEYDRETQNMVQNFHSIDYFTNWLDTKIEEIRQEEMDNEENDLPLQLLNHSTKATDYFSFKKDKTDIHNTFLGVELELEKHSQQEYNTLNLIKNHAIFKRDGSLTNGVEICSAPATLETHKKAFLPFFAGLQTNQSKLQASPNCGMHVHIDKRKLSPLHIAQLCFLLNNSDNEPNIVQIAGRAPNQYCSREHYTYKTFVQTNLSNNRYRRVNLSNEKTIELRLFASTTDFKTFCARLEFTQAVIDYTKPGETSFSCKEIPKWVNFTNYITKHKSFYPNLIKTLNTT